MQQETLHAAILGSDLILAALPAEPVQVVNACLALGYDIVVPASWGDELVASAVLDELAMRPPGCAIMCSCPHARRRLFNAGNELAPFAVQTVSPPVAAARYLRALNSEKDLRVTFIGGCPDIADESITERFAPTQFLDLCARRGLSLAEQPRVFESFIPTDRRRYFSLPGGLPESGAVNDVHPETEVLNIDGSSLAFDVAQCVVSGRPTLIDIAAAVGCACSGFVGETALRDARETIAALEPPRSGTPVVDARIAVELDLPGQNNTPAYEESVPLNVVVNADLNGLVDVHGSESERLEEAANDLEMTWSDPDFAFDGAGEYSRNGAESHHRDPDIVEDQPARTRNSTGTPTGTPAVRTAAGPLPRAYLMMRKLRASGEHPALSGSTREPSRNEQQEPPVQAAPPTAPESSQSSIAPRPLPDRRTPAGGASAANKGTVDTVLDILTKAIRDVVEPR